MHYFEFELRRLADQVNGPFRIREAGQLHDDTLCALTTDAWFADAKGINTVADFFQRLINGTGPEVLDFCGRHVVQPHFRGLLPHLAGGVLVTHHLLHHTPLGRLTKHQAQALQTIGFHRHHGQAFGDQIPAQRLGAAFECPFDGFVDLHLQEQMEATLQV